MRIADRLTIFLNILNLGCQFSFQDRNFRLSLTMRKCAIGVFVLWVQNKSFLSHKF